MRDQVIAGNSTLISNWNICFHFRKIRLIFESNALILIKCQKKGTANESNGNQYVIKIFTYQWFWQERKITLLLQNCWFVFKWSKKWCLHWCDILFSNGYYPLDYCPLGLSLFKNCFIRLTKKSLIWILFRRIWK